MSWDDRGCQPCHQCPQTAELSPSSSWCHIWLHLASFSCGQNLVQNSHDKKTLIIAGCIYTTFLDTKVKLINGVIVTELYTKPTDQHLYLHSNSDHPGKTKKAIPYGLGIRLKRICSDTESYVKHRKTLKEHLYRRGYKKSEVEHQLRKVDNLNRNDLLHKSQSTKQPQDRVPLVLTYSSSLPNIHQILRTRAHILQNSERLNRARN